LNGATAEAATRLVGAPVVLPVLASFDGESDAAEANGWEGTRESVWRPSTLEAGRIVEEGTSQGVLEDPQAEYTRELIAAIPHPPQV
jgi:hypothetical protein